MFTDGMHKREDSFFEDWAKELKEELFNFWIDFLD